ARPAAAAYKLPDLPYAYDALEPHIDTQTMTIHHQKHHAAYITKLNAALETHPELAAKSPQDLIRDLSSIPEAIRSAVQNQGGGHVNHSFFWTIMGPKQGGKPQGELAAAIKSTFNSFDNFQKVFSDAAANRFGSGWAWLVKSAKGLEVVSTA